MPARRWRCWWALVALVQIWRTGFAGAGLAGIGILLPLLAFAGPLFYLAAFLNLPRINDVTTDLASPPRFVALAKRTDGANPSAYPGQTSAEVQAKAYPDLRTVVMDRSAEETFELVEEAVRRLRWRVVAAEPPTGKAAKAGIAGGHRSDAAGGLHRRYRHSRRGQRHRARASTCAPPRATASSTSARTPPACASSSPNCRRAWTRPRPAS